MNRYSGYSKYPPFQKALILAIGLLLFCAFACDLTPTIYLEDGKPARLRYKGKGYLECFVVSEIAPENQRVPDVEQDNDKNKTLWWIIPKALHHQFTTSRQL